MYYPRVNRGLSFTKPGVYAFGLVLFIGMTAVTTGINGLYVFLSAGLGGFIISGILSERAIKSCSVRSLAATLVDAETPFKFQFIIENSSPWFAVFAMRCLFLTAKPTFHLISKEPATALARIRLTRLSPGSRETREALAQGLARGAYDQILVLQQTTFPFGILEKFKLLELPCSLLAAPSLDPSLLDHLRQLLRRSLLLEESSQDFHSHRPYRQENNKHIDWKKSAARDPGHWVVKQYKSPEAFSAIRIEAPWSLALQLKDEASYEDFLRRVRTALKAVEEIRRDFVLDFGHGQPLAGREACLSALAAAPPFSERARGPFTRVSGSAATAASPTGLRLVITATGCEWQTAPARPAGRPISVRGS